VNVLVSHEQESGAPVLYEDNPGFQDLIGRVEYMAQYGALVTNFTLIRPGALHRPTGVICCWMCMICSLSPTPGKP